mgnify:CR=1 FL=1
MVESMPDMFKDADDLSDENKCAIHTSFSSNNNWPYNWGNYCPFQFETRDELKIAVDEWIDDPDNATIDYGGINTWDTSLITDMSELFYNNQTFYLYKIRLPHKAYLPVGHHPHIKSCPSHLEVLPTDMHRHIRLSTIH